MTDFNSKTPWYLDQPLGDLKMKYQYIQYKEDLRLRDATLNPETSNYSLGVSVLRENSKRNRYCDIMPYERNRVTLNTLHSTNNYINASYIKLDFLANTKKYYIATQGPTKRTLHQFWTMVFQKCVLGPDVVIVMVTPLVEQNREKCFPYWPSSISEEKILHIPKVQNVDGKNDISVFEEELNLEFISEEKYYHSPLPHAKEQHHNHIYTKLKLTNLQTGEYRNIHHLYFDKWADMSSPTSVDNILGLITHCNELNAKFGNPVISHCSAGVGRTGTFIALDYLYTSYLGNHRKLVPSVKHETSSTGEHAFSNTADSEHQQKQNLEDLVQKTVLKLRSQRMHMVQTFNQYLFLYKAVKTFYVAD
ncbi:hypothetical protein ACO0QE_000964 [Hanseniaspora vineae]